jgi:hypothetical protein
MSDHPRAVRVSELLDQIDDLPGRKVAVADIVTAFGDRAFGALMFVFAAPLVLPMPPGVSALLGAPLIFITGQWMLGRKTLWLPKALLDRNISKNDFRSLSQKLKPYLEKLERRLRPRLTFMYNPFGDRLVGLLCFLLALIVFLPIPFGNMLPSLAIAAFAIGGAERDGLAAIFGWVTAILSIAVLWFFSKAIIAAVIAFFSTLLGIVT